MKFLPVGLNVQGKRCVVAGGGKIGARKVRNLLRAGARVTLVSPEATEEMVELATSGEITWTQETFENSHLGGAFLAVVATDDETLNALMVDEARRLGMLVCDASSGARSQVIFGALHEDEGVTVAVFTDGRDPSQARKTRDEIGAFLARGPESDGS